MERFLLRRPIARWLSGLLAGALAVAALTGLVGLLNPHVSAQHLFVLYVLPVMVIAMKWGTGLATVTAVMSAVAFSYFFLSPHHSFAVTDLQSLVALGVFLVTAVVVGQLAAQMRRKAQESARLAEEQSALRRVATLAAQPVSPSVVFEAVTKEVGQLCHADLARMEHYEEDGSVIGVAAWSRVPTRLAVGTRFGLEGPSIARAVRQTQGPARVSGFAEAAGEIAQESREAGIHSSVGCPIVVAGRLWGVIAASTRSPDPFPPNTEVQIAGFTEIVATAIANAESRIQLAASRARVVAAGDEMRRRLERNLHDSLQQRLVSLALRLRLTQNAVPVELPALRADLGRATQELTEAVEELRETTRGIHPAILSTGGLGLALRALARRSVVPVDLHIDTQSRYPPPVEVTAYYVVAEALTNIAKHARASHAEVVVDQRDSTLWVSVRDDGVGGAGTQRGSGLIGLHDRVEAIDGTVDLTSPAGQGTLIQVSLPLQRPADRFQAIVQPSSRGEDGIFLLSRSGRACPLWLMVAQLASVKIATRADLGAAEVLPPELPGWSQRGRWHFSADEEIPWHTLEFFLFRRRLPRYFQSVQGAGEYRGVHAWTGIRHRRWAWCATEPATRSTRPQAAAGRAPHGRGLAGRAPHGCGLRKACDERRGACRRRHRRRLVGRCTAPPDPPLPIVQRQQEERGQQQRALGYLPPVRRQGRGAPLRRTEAVARQ
jgi:signal transduction histidine kinase